MDRLPATASSLLDTLGVTSMVTAATKRKRRRSRSRSSSNASSRRHHHRTWEAKSNQPQHNDGTADERRNDDVTKRSMLCAEVVQSLEEHDRGARKGNTDRVAQRVTSWMATADTFGADPDVKKTLMEEIREILLGSRLSNGRPSKSGIEDLCAVLKAKVLTTGTSSSKVEAELTGPLDLLDQCMLRALVSRNYSQLIVFWYVFGAILATFAQHREALRFLESLTPHFVESYLAWIRPIVSNSVSPTGEDEEVVAVSEKVRRMLPMFEMWRHCLSMGTMEVVRQYTRARK